jgi:predicted transposase YbfD/YdcC
MLVAEMQAFGMLQSFVEMFSALEDPRVHQNKIHHKLLDIVTITVCAVICGADDWIDIVDFGEAKQEWLKQFLELPNGIPSHDTFSRVFSMINPEEFGKLFISWVSQMATRANGRVVPIDGKTLRRSHDGDASPLHMVSAFCSDNRLVLGQIATEEKSNEITAIPALLDILDVEGATVTIDAMGAQKDIVHKIRDKGADYVIGLKTNQPKLHEGVEETFASVQLDAKATKQLGVHGIEDSSHGRDIIQQVFVTNDLSEIPTAEQWTDLRSVAMVITEFIDNKGRLTTERRYYFSSLEPNAKAMAHAIRAHWSIENSLHWVLDVTFHEDYSRVRRDNGAQNLAVMRHAALNLIRQEKATKGSIKTKRKRAGWDNGYLETLLFGA